MKNQPDRNVLDEHREGNDSAEARGADHRSNAQDRPLNSFPLPSDPHDPTPKGGHDFGQKDSAELSDYGLNEAVEVGNNCTVAQWGIGGRAGFDKNQQRAPSGSTQPDSRFDENAIINDDASRKPLERNPTE